MPGLESALMHLLQINKLNHHYEKVSHLQGKAFVDAVLDLLGVKVDFNAEELAYIPREGGFIVISNHPYGGVDGLILLKLISAVRSDTKLMANFLLQRIPNIREHLIAVNPFDTFRHPSSLSGTRLVLEHLRHGSPVVIFPAGEVSAYDWDIRKTVDRPWHPVVGKVIAKAGVPVLPVYFHGHNGMVFNILGMINPSMRTARLPAELFNKKGRKICVRLGSPLKFKKLAPAAERPDDLLCYLRTRTYALGLGKKMSARWWLSENIFHVRKKPKPLMPLGDLPVLQKEIDSIVSYRLISEGVFEVYAAPASCLPVILKEIGILREETFRAVGEGTNKPLDLDMFDIYYHHLFIWDTSCRCIVGAYRLGRGDDLYYAMGRRGFYLSLLFKMSDKLDPLLQSSLELGRSWVRIAYQKHPLPLYLLWKGVAAYLLRHSQYRYLIGPVSISNDFSTFSKSLFALYLKQNHFDEHMAKLVKPRKAFKPPGKTVDQQTLIRGKKSLKDLENLIHDIESKHLRMPVLLRQYLKLNAKIIAFNVDPKFSDCLDGFLVLDLRQVPEEMLLRYSK